MQFPFFSLKMRFVRASILSSWAAVNAMLEKYNYGLTFKYNDKLAHKINKETFEQCNPDLALSLKHSTQIIKQAFNDVNFKGNVYVFIYTKPEEMKATSPLQLSCTYFYNNQFEPYAKVEILKYPNEVTDHNTFYRQMYAVGGHEAIHAKHKHELMRPVMTAFAVGLSPILGSLIFGLHENRIQKVMEMDADLTSSWKLGTALDLRQVFINAKNYIKDMPKSNTQDIFFSDPPVHPTLENRIGYLGLFSKVLKQRPKLLQSQLWQDIQQERKNVVNKR